MSFYCFDVPCRAELCTHSIFRDHVRYFFSNNIIAEFEYEPIDIFREIVFPSLSLDFPLHTFANEAEESDQFNYLKTISQQLYESFYSSLLSIAETEVKTKEQFQKYAENCKKELTIYLDEINKEDGIIFLKR